MFDKQKINREQKKLREIGKRLFYKAEDFNCKPLISKLIKDAIFELNSLIPKYVSAENLSLLELQNNLKFCLERITTVEHFHQELGSRSDEEGSWYVIVAPWLKQIGDQLNKTHFNYSTESLEIILPNQQKTESMLIKNISKDISDISKFSEFLGINKNWMSATCALQIQEVAVTIVAKQKGIKLDRRNVTEIAKNSQSSEPAFSKKYEAFCIEVKNRYNIEMPLLITDLRDMRKSVLHQGYTPKEEEIVPIIYFTLGLLKRLKSVSEAT